MELIRFKNHVPETYVTESRDFQIFTRILDLTQNSIKHNIDNIPLILDSDNINEYYIDHLKTKLGFFTNTNIPDDILRFMLSAFPYIIKYKGSVKGIIRCVNLFSKLNGITSKAKIDVSNDDYTIKIGINSLKVDATSLDELLKYVIPTGYIVKIYFYKDTSLDNIITEFGQASYLYTTTDKNELTSVRNESNVTPDSFEEKLFNKVQLSVVHETNE